jgi:hypothetical protein
MQNAESRAAMTEGKDTPAEPVEFHKRIGSTDYVVSVLFSRTSKETLEDKVSRLIESEVRESA